MTNVITTEITPETTTVMTVTSVDTLVVADIEAPASTPTTTVMSTEIRRAYPECPDCGGLLDRDGTCPFKDHHQRRYGT